MIRPTDAGTNQGEEESLMIKPAPAQPARTEPQETSKPKEEKLVDIDPEFLIQSEQDKLKKREKRKKMKNLWKDHVKVLKQMEEEEKAMMDAAKRNTLLLAQNLEYEDEYDDLEFERTMSKQAADVTNGKL